ncbi:arsenate reductase [Ferruginibacter lapsinanis]|uniref:arsenate reductase n=1 Tax=Ferruginibacter lapsinanis TaxID=563172 RepID=UPI001E3CF4F1|nr:arsenate reductase [Ferruginibacter lapsinanis]UEG50929.1 arsenate reductase [Ferruginibacter lapsinanis]
MSQIIIYGIPNCDTIKKTLDWFKQHNVEYKFHDYKKSGITKEKLKQWCKQVGWETILNKKSSTWRGLTPGEQAKITTQAAAIELIAANTSIIKRPVIENNTQISIVGFDVIKYNELFL